MQNDKIKDFIIKNSKYIAAGVMVVALVGILAITTFNKKKDSGSASEEVVSLEDSTVATADTTAQNKFELDKYEDVNALVAKYYKAYADGDVATLKQIATPFTDEEAKQKTALKDYIESFDNLACYTKVGPVEDSYMVAVYLEIKFKDIKTTAPGLTTLYICKNDDGSLYIDNRAKEELEPEVQAYAQAFEKAEDYLELSQKVSDKYNESLEKDEALKTFMEVTINQITSGEAQTADTTTEETNTDTKKTETTTKETTKEETKTESTSETVWVTEDAKIRKGPGEDQAQLGSAYKGDYFKRTAIRDDGWSEIEYKGEKAYIKTDFVSTTNPVEEDTDSNSTSSNGTKVFHTEGQKITVENATNIRASMDESSKLMGTAAPGDTVTVILDYAEGWTKVEWNGKTGYIRTDLL